MLQYIINIFRSGVSDENARGVIGSFKYGYALNIHDRSDSLSCNQSMASVGGSTVDTLINFFVSASDGTTYCFGATGSVYARSGDGAWNLAYNDENGAILGAAEWELSDGNNYLYWATATSVARMALNGSVDLPWAAGVATQNYKTTLNTADWHTMKNAMGMLCIANGNYLATIDYIGNFNASSLNIRPGNLINCLEERDDYVIFGSQRADESEEGHIWSWLVTAQNYVQKKKIPIKGVNAMIDTELMLLQGGDNGELFYSDFVNKVPISAIPGGGKVNPGGVTINNDLAAFGFYGGDYPGIWEYGRRHKNRPQSLNYSYRLAKTVAGSSVSTLGAIAVVNGEMLASWGTTDGSTLEYGVDSSSSTVKATARYESLEFDAKVPHITKVFDTVKLRMSPLPSGASVSVLWKADKMTTGGDSSAGAGWRYAVFGDGATTFSTAEAVECIAKISDDMIGYEVAVELNPTSNSSPEILAITTYFKDMKQKYA